MAPLREAQLLDALDRAGAASFAPRVLVLAAHPDDETIGFGGLLGRCADVFVATATDGAPRAPRFAREVGFPDRARYAAARRDELRAAMALAGIGDDRLVALGAVDLEAASAIERLARDVAELCARLAPAIVITHAYEGGHPDHDALGVVARAALGRVAERPLLLEMAGYHAAADGRLVTGAFVEMAPSPSRAFVLRDDERARKIAMLDAHASQARVLEAFRDVARERLRRAPRVDYREPPRAPQIHYERVGFGVTFAAFRCEVSRALERLGLGPDAGWS